MLPIAWIIGATIVSVGTTYYKNKEEDENKQNKQNKANNDKQIRSKIETLPFFIATSYAMANIDGDISEDEENLIQIYREEIYDLIPKDELPKFKNVLTKIKNEKKEIKLSDAISYLKSDDERYAKDEIKKSLEKIMWADLKDDPREVELLDRIKIFIEKGKYAQEEIKRLENNDLLPNYYLTTDTKTKPLTKDDKKFKNIEQLPLDTYYVKHPMNDKILFDVTSIDNIETLIIDEWYSLAHQLGAKSFNCTVELEEITESSSEHDINIGVDSQYYNGNVNQKNQSVSKDYQENFNQFCFTWAGEKCTHTEQYLLDNLLWLKKESKALTLIKSRTSSNPQKSFEATSSLKKFSSKNKSFNLTAHLSLLGKINPSIKKGMEENIKKHFHYKQKIEIIF